jgi:hypothetical protein
MSENDGGSGAVTRGNTPDAPRGITPAAGITPGRVS